MGLLLARSLALCVSLPHIRVLIHPHLYCSICYGLCVEFGCTSNQRTPLCAIINGYDEKYFYINSVIEGGRPLPMYVETKCNGNFIQSIWNSVVNGKRTAQIITTEKKNTHTHKRFAIISFKAQILTIYCAPVATATEKEFPGNGKCL